MAFSLPVNSTYFPLAGGLAWWARLLIVGLGLGLMTLLVAAAMLQPDARGFGTHQQLGLPPCAATQIFGVRCPSCGMTTSWALFARGRILDSQQANSGGLLMAICASVAAPWLIVSGLRGAWLWRRPSEVLIVTIALLVFLVTLVDWVTRTFL